MAHKLGIKVIAEGGKPKVIKQIGCGYGQGYLWSKPLPAKDYEKLLYV